MRILLITAFALAAAGPALAQSDFPEPPQMAGPPMGGGQGGGQWGGMRPPERETLAQFQARMGQLFERLDANHDGVVDATELANGRGGRMLTRFDADNDGRITRAEFDAGVQAEFKTLDKNGDGVVTADERPQRPQR